MSASPAAASSAGWAWIEAERGYGHLEELRERAASEGKPATGTDGCCAWCGVRESITWTNFGHCWANGQPAPLCEQCGAFYDRYGQPDPADWDGEQRRLMVAAACGVTPMMGYGWAALPSFAERAEDPHVGTEPWAHVDPDALHRLRLAEWARFEGLRAPTSTAKAEALAFDRARREEQSRLAREQSEQERQRENEIWGL